MVGNSAAADHPSLKGKTASDDESDSEFGEFKSQGESLLTLVQPELVSLSRHWIAALRDHALLSLPPGF